MTLSEVRTNAIDDLRQVREEAPELLVAVILGALLRIYNLGDESIWLDEAYSIVVAQESSWRYLLFEHSGVDPHPPLHYLLTKLWIVIFNNSEFSTRFLSVLLSLAAIPVVYYLGRHLFDRFVGGVAAVLMALSPFQIWYAQEVRMYALFVLLTAASFYALVRLLDTWSRDRLIAYAVISALLGYTHVYGLFVLGTQGLFVLWRAYRVDTPRETPLAVSFRQAVVAFGAIGTLLLPWLLALVIRLNESTSRIAWISAPDLSAFRRAVTAVSFGYTSDAGYQLTPPVIWILLLAAGCVFLAITRPSFRHFVATEAPDGESLELPEHVRPAVLLLALWAVVPVVAAWLVSVYVTPLFLLRPLIAVSPAVMLLFAVGARSFAGLPLPHRPILPVAVALLLVSGMLMPLPSYYGNDHKEQWEDAAMYVEEGVTPGDIVILAPTYIDRPFLYYFDDEDVTVISLMPGEDPGEYLGPDDDPDNVYLVLRGVWGEERDRLISETGSATGVALDQQSASFIGVDVYRYHVLTFELNASAYSDEPLSDNFTRPDLSGTIEDNESD